MTFEEYFKKPQPIDDSLIDDALFYKSIVNIEYGTEAHYLIIKIAHIGDNLWSFGWEIKDGAARPIEARECTPNIITKGQIEHLIYGMTKVVFNHVNNEMHTDTIKQVAHEAISKALFFSCEVEKENVGKITI